MHAVAKSGVEELMASATAERSGEESSSDFGLALYEAQEARATQATRQEQEAQEALGSPATGEARGEEDARLIGAELDELVAGSVARDAQWRSDLAAPTQRLIDSLVPSSDRSVRPEQGAQSLAQAESHGNGSQPQASAIQAGLDRVGGPGGPAPGGPLSNMGELRQADRPLPILSEPAREISSAPLVAERPELDPSAASRIENGNALKQGAPVEMRVEPQGHPVGQVGQVAAGSGQAEFRPVEATQLAAATQPPFRSGDRAAARSANGAVPGVRVESARAAESEGLRSTAPRSEPHRNDREIGVQAERDPAGQRLEAQHELAASRIATPTATPTATGNASPLQPILVNAPAPAAIEAAIPMSSTASAGPSQSAEAVLQQAEMLAQRGGGTVRIRLHPAHLGEVDITVATRGNSVDIVIRAEESGVQAAVMAQREQLADALGARDLRMENFDVLNGSRDRASQDGQAFREHTEPRFAGSAGGSQAPESANQLDDTSVPTRPLATAASARIDVRI